MIAIKFYVVPTDRIPTEELKQMEWFPVKNSVKVPTDRIPTEELKP